MQNKSARQILINNNTSAALDLLRLMLALIVAAGHWTKPQFQDGWPDLTQMGVVAVGGFFIISGYTVRFITAKNDSLTLSQYTIERMSRLWSVMLPALLLTIVCDFFSNYFNPGLYQANWGQYADYPVLRVLLNIFFLSQIWGYDISPLSNTPFWSLGFEAPFYALYGLLFFKRRRRWWLFTGLAALLFGPQILFMMLFWLAGAAIFELGRRCDRLWLLLALGALGLLAAALMIYHFSYVKDVIGYGIWRFFSYLANSSQRLTKFLAFGCMLFIPIVLSLVCLCKALHVSGLSVSTKTVKRMRKLGNFTFPVYLLHFPVFILIGSLGFYDRTSIPQKAVIFLIVLCAIFAVSGYFESFKYYLRSEKGIIHLAYRFAQSKSKP